MGQTRCTTEESVWLRDEENELWMERCRYRLVLRGESGKVISSISGPEILKTFGQQMGRSDVTFHVVHPPPNPGFHFSHGRQENL